MNSAHPTDAVARPSRASLAEQVARTLSDRVADGTYPPGSQLPTEGELMETFGVARTVVREALAKLRAIGVVQVFQGKGAFVSDVPLDVLLLNIRRLSPGETLLPHVWEMREILETRVAFLAALRRDDDDLARLEDAVLAMEAALTRGEIGLPEDEAFHRHLMRAAKNPVVESVMHELSALVNASRRSSLERQHRPRASNDEHRLILRAVRDRDADAAAAAMQTHLRHGLPRPR
ncbi:FadR/GntR family transcriptional regulator [Deinococcus pimensis]|uniref:FadR/GntR family transcriptional regulator n=1 Tax=Deinococcus pimensis TaxID=309888 RepID=UPI0004855420|nr:FadR/GntR family transcriptional regulator [Deinococcus pimensis]